eukprot:366023-Chlamydomonas_euryale.AAC.4
MEGGLRGWGVERLPRMLKTGRNAALEGSPPLIDLPTGRSRPAEPSGNTRTVSFKVTAAPRNTHAFLPFALLVSGGVKSAEASICAELLCGRAYSRRWLTGRHLRRFARTAVQSKGRVPMAHSTQTLS